MPRVDRRRYAAPVLLALALVAAQSSVFLLGRTLLPIAPSLTTMPGAPFGYDGPRPDAPTSIDPAGAMNYSFTADAYNAIAFREGTLPFWNPHQGLGAPFLASGLPASLYPLTPLLRWMPRERYEFVYLFNWFLAALFTCAYLRCIEVGREGAVLGGLAIVCSGFFQYYFAEREVIVTGAWFPALLYVVERTIREPHWRARHLAIAATIYCVVTAGQPESTFVALAAATVYGVASFVARRTAVQSIAALAPGVVAGALLSAPLWWNFADYAFTAYSAHGEGAAVAQAQLGWRTLASYVMPQLYGRLHTLPPALVPHGWSWDLSPGWIPVAAAFGAVFGAWRALITRSRPLLLVLALGLIVAGRIWGIWPLTMLSAVPIVDRVVFPRYAAFVVAFAAAILAGAGFDAALNARPREWRWTAIIWLASAATLYAMTGIWREPVFRPIQVRAFSVLIAMWTIAVPAGLLWLRARVATGPALGAAAAAAMMMQFVAAKPGPAPEMYAVLTVACLLAWTLMLVLFSSGGRRSVPTAWFASVTLAVCALPPLALALSDRRGLPVQYDAATEPPYVARLRALQSATGGRAFAFDATPQPNFALPFGIDQLNTLEAILPHGVARFFERHLDPGTNPLWFSANTGQRRSAGAVDQYVAHRRYFDLAAVRFLLARTTALPRDAGLRLLYADATTGVQIFENERALPRAFLACPALRIADADDALARLDEVTDLRRDVVVDRLDGDPCAGASRPPSGALESFSSRLNEVTVRYRADTGGILVLADAYDPGWRATLDGQPADVLRIDGVFRGIVVPTAGSHVARFRYRPPHWRASLLAAAAGAAVLLTAMASAAASANKGQSAT